MKKIRIILIVSTAFLLRADAADELWPKPSYEEGASPALPNLDKNPVLADYLAYAALKNAGLEAAFNRWQAALKQIDQAGVLPDPKFTYAYFIEEVETRVGPQVQAFGLSQKFPWFGTLHLRGEVAAEAANAAFEEYQALKLKLFYEVKRAYFEYHYLYRSVHITEDNIRLLKHFEGVALSKHRAGASQAGVIKAQVELGKLEDRLRSLRDLRGTVVAGLNAALNRPLESELPWPVHVPLLGADLTEGAVFDELRISNPELKVLESLTQKEVQSIALARKASLPDFVLGVDYIDTDEALIAGTPDSGKDPFIARIAIDIPLWRGKYRAEVEEAERRHHSLELAKEQKIRSLESGLKMAMYRYRDADRKVDLYGNTLIQQAEHALKVTEQAYRVGSEDFLNLIDAERLLLEFQLAHERALVDREIAVAEIEKMIGRSVSSLTPNREFK